MLQKALNYWNALQPYRTERLRCKNYTYGRQYLDTVTRGNRRMTEEEYIRSEGNVPLKNNLIRRIVRNVLGVFRNNMHLPTAAELGLDENDASDMLLLERLRRSYREENLRELYSRLMEEYLIGGLVAVKKVSRGSGRGDTVGTEAVRPDSFFFNLDANDPRGHDITAIGEIHRVPLERAVSAFAHTPEEARRLEALASETPERGTPDTPCLRIVEYWQLEERRHWVCHDPATGSVFRSEDLPEGVDNAVWRSQPVWRYYFIAADGAILREGDSPWGAAGHPYVMKAYPFIDGEIHSFVADCIDQQRYINRLITLNDWILRSSAKGILMIPDGSVPDDLEPRDIADQWSRFNGVITYRHQDGVPAPHQVSGNAANIGISELLAVQLKMMEDVSGVNAALQGQLTSGAISGTLYEMQTRQALTGLADILQGFENFMRESAQKETLFPALPPATRM